MRHDQTNMLDGLDPRNPCRYSAIEVLKIVGVDKLNIIIFYNVRDPECCWKEMGKEQNMIPEISSPANPPHRHDQDGDIVLAISLCYLGIQCEQNKRIEPTPIKTRNQLEKTEVGAANIHIVRMNKEHINGFVIGHIALSVDFCIHPGHWANN